MFTGMQLTDEVHWRDVYERNGSFRCYSMGRKRFGKWFIRDNELCVDLPEPDGGCFEVRASGKRIVMKPTGPGLALEGVLQKPSGRK